MDVCDTRPMTKTLAARISNIVLLCGMVAAVVIGALSTPGSEHSGLYGPGDSFVKAQRKAAPVNVPVWEKGDICKDINTIPENHISATVLVVKQDSSRVVMSLDEATNRGNNKNEADNVWVIGYCE